MAHLTMIMYYLTMIMHYFNILSAQPLVQNEQVLVYGVGRDEDMPPMLIHRPTGFLNSFLIMLFQTPTLCGSEETQECHPANTLFIWAPGACQFYGHPHRKFMHSWVHCDGPGIHQLVRQYALPLNQPLKLSDSLLFRSLLSSMYSELTTQGTPDITIITPLLEMIFRDIGRHRETTSNPIPERLRLIREHIDRYFASPLTLSGLAARAHLSPTHFARLFRTHYKISPVDYLIQQRLQRAAVLLRGANIKIAEIAAMCGYEDPFYFSKLIKKHTGFSPTELRTGRDTLRPAPGRGKRRK